MASLSCLPMSLYNPTSQRTLQAKYKIFYCSQNHVKHLLGVILQLSSPIAKPDHVINFTRVIVIEETPSNLDTQIALFRIPQNGILKFHVEVGKSDGDQGLTKKCWKENISFYQSLKAMELETSQRMSELNLMCHMEGKKRNSTQALYQLTTDLVLILFLFHQVATGQSVSFTEFQVSHM